MTKTKAIGEARLARLRRLDEARRKLAAQGVVFRPRTTRLAPVISDSDAEEF
jgi:hypothetical protein